MNHRNTPPALPPTPSPWRPVAKIAAPSPDPPLLITMIPWTETVSLLVLCRSSSRGALTLDPSDYLYEDEPTATNSTTTNSITTN